MNYLRPFSSIQPYSRYLVAAAVALLSVAHASANTAAAAPKADLAKGEASYTAVCAACHGPDGNSATPANPKLAGQHQQYIQKQLTEFKSGKRASAVMSGMVAALTPEDILNISAWVSQQKPKSGTAKDKDSILLGEKIYRGGIADRQIAACSGCHSPNGAGMPAQYPRLSGQQNDYTVAQLTAFRDGSRKNSVQMTQVAAKMNDREIKAVSDYIAGLR